MDIEISIYKNNIIENVKVETYFKGELDKTATDNEKVSFVDKASNAALKEKKIDRAFTSALTELKGLLSIYVKSIEETAEGGFTLAVDRNVNLNTVSNLDSACEKFIEDRILMLWWGPINQTQAAFYSTMLEEDREIIERCLHAAPPTAPKSPYTREILWMSTSAKILVGETHYLEYEIDDGAIDDIRFLVSQMGKIKTTWEDSGISNRGLLKIEAIETGKVYLQLYSAHDDSVKSGLFPIEIVKEL